MMPINTAVSFDMLSPAWATPTHDLHGAALEMAALADAIGVDRIGLMEQHGSDDGFPPEEGWKSLELLKNAIPKLKALPR